MAIATKINAYNVYLDGKKLIGVSDEDYIIYKGVRYTNKTFNKLKMILNNETNLAALEEL